MDRERWAQLQLGGGALAALCLIGLVGLGARGGFSGRREARFAAAFADSRSPIAWASLGNARLALSLHDAALQAYGKALAAAPDDPGALIGRAMTRWLIGELDGAEEDYRRLIALQPDRVLHLTQLEKVYRERNKLVEVAQMWEDARLRHPDDKNWDATTRVLGALYEARAWERLEERASEALAADGSDEPKRMRYSLYRGVAHGRLGRHREAFEELESAAARSGWTRDEAVILSEELVASAAALGETAKAEHYRGVFAANCQEGCRP
jgi:tetratricopeptide (TPR) repeat protein